MQDYRIYDIDGSSPEWNATKMNEIMAYIHYQCDIIRRIMHLNRACMYKIQSNTKLFRLVVYLCYISHIYLFFDLILRLKLSKAIYS